MLRDTLKYDYFEWLYNLACGIRYSKHISYRTLLAHLHTTRFEWVIPRDKNRADEGIDLRYRFALVSDYSESVDDILDALEGPCSILEMMVALAIHAEDIMDDAEYGDRTGQWFWSMIISLGLGSMTDDRYDTQYVDSVIDIFLNREYEPNGKGGLFTIRNCDRDLTTVEIWHQLCWYLNSIT